MRRAVATIVTLILTTTGGYLYGQQQAQPPANIRTGNDIGFRLDRMEHDQASVTLMVRTRTGDWVVARLSSDQLGLIPLESR